MRIAPEASRRQVVAVLGNASLPAGDPRYGLATTCGRLLIDHGYRVLTGGLGGIMEAACKGARMSESYREGDTIGLLPGHDPAEANPYVDIPIATGLDFGRNAVVANADAVLAIGGGSGTLAEVALAWQLKRLIVALRVEGWSGKLADTRIDGRKRYLDMPDDRVYGVDGPRDAVRLLAEMLPRYSDRHTGIRRRDGQK